MVATKNELKVGQVVKLKGCFTEELFLRGLTLSQIGVELGLPSHRLNEGVFISFALQLPTVNQFDLGGWAEYSTDNFISYGKNGAQWSEKDFEKTYKDKRMPITIEEAKKGWLMNMRQEKLIKIIPVIPHSNDDFYPSGGKASQVIIKQPINCQIVKFLKRGEVFNSVWA